MALVDHHPQFKEAIINGCDWLSAQISERGQICSTSTKEEDWLEKNRFIPEAYRLYALEPLLVSAKKWNIAHYAESVERALHYYTGNETFTEFNTLSHFHAYILEALIDLGQIDCARQGMETIALLQRENGAIPAYHDVHWVCSTGLFQYAVIWYKLGMTHQADLALSYGSKLQNKSGGFFGSYGLKATYIANQEISWAVKYFLDALWWHYNRQTKVNE